MNVTLQLVSASGQALLPETTVFLSYATATGSERIERQLSPSDGKLRVEPQKATEFLSRLRVFAPPADLVFDMSFAADHLWPAAMTITVRESARPRSLRMRVGPLVRLGLVHTGPVSITQLAAGQLPEIEGLRISGGPGVPSLPVEIHHVLIPPSERVASITAIPDPAPVRIAGPQPHLQPPLVLDTPNPRRVRPVEMPGDRFRPLTGRFPAESVRLQRVDQHVWGAVATIEVWPVHYDAEAKEYVHQPNLAYDLATTPIAAPSEAPLFPSVQSRDQALTVNSLLLGGRVTIVGSSQLGVWLIDPAALISSAPASMVIITDDATWSGTSPTPPFLGSAAIIKGAVLPLNSAGNGLVAEFERLAYWKTARGIRTKVVPITTIMRFYTAGDLAPFLSGPALDLPEIIRAFILYAAKNWQTNFVLLGGTRDIIPMREVVASRGPDYSRGNPTPPNATIVAISSGQLIAKIAGPNGYAVDLRDATVPIDNSFSLVCVSSGTVLPFSHDGSGARGWYFTTEADFINKTTGFTIRSAPADPKNKLFAIAFGGSELQDDFAWVWPGRASETDHYYSELTRAPGGRHDFDANGNLLLGQIAPSGDADTEIDGVQVTGTMFVGRAPVANAIDARNFVDKVIGYEQVHAIDAPPIDPAYLHKLTLYADDWARPWLYAQTAAPAGKTVPDVAQFVWTGTDVIIQLENDDGLVNALKQADITGSLNFSLQAMADVSGEVIPIPYDPSGQSAPGWFFCDAGYNRLTPTAGTKGTQYVRIAHAPVGFDTLFWQNVAVDYGSVQKERVHKGWKSQFPSLAAVRRIYRDYPDFPDQDIEPVLQETANAALDEGAHFFSVTGHGNVNNVGYITYRACANTGRPFIMYAHSCLTADPETQPSLGAHFVTQRNGALAYVGYARTCWTGDPAADYELGFWCGVSQFRRLGPPVSLHLNSAGWQQFAHIFIMVLYGDPEMPVWTTPPRPLQVTFTYSITPDGPLKGLEGVEVVASDQSQPVPGLNVTAVQGWKGSLTEPVWFGSTTTDDSGLAIVLLKSPRSDPVRIVVSTPAGSSGPLYIPVIKDYAVGQTT